MSAGSQPIPWSCIDLQGAFLDEQPRRRAERLLNNIHEAHPHMRGWQGCGPERRRRPGGGGAAMPTPGGS